MRRVPCADELTAAGDARRSDWLLENAQARYFVRDTPDALTRLGAAGGTVVDATAGGADDLLVEAVPLISGGWFTAADATPTTEDGAVTLDITGTLADGSAATITYRLRADDPVLEIVGADGLSLVPTAGAALYGATLDTGGSLLGVLGAAAVTDHGGWVTVEGTSGLISGDRDTVYETAYAGQRRLLREATGAWLEVFDADDQPLARVPIRSGQAAATVPDDAASVQATATGAAPSARVPINDTSPLSVGPEASLWLRVVDGEGGMVPATVRWQGADFSAVPYKSPLPIGPGAGTLALYAGPGRELAAATLDLSEGGDETLSVSMPWAVTPGALVALDVPSSPDRTERRESADILAEQAARGVHYAVQVATDSVSVGRTSQQEPFIYSQLGSRSSGIGTPMAWPWAASRNRPAYGATDSDGLSAEDLLAVMSRRGNRMLVVTPDWIDAAGPPVGWFPAPDMLRIEGLDDLDTVFTVYDAWLPLSLVGPLTWVDSVDPREPFESVDIAAGLIDGQTTATSGPRLHLSVGDAQIGDVASVQAPFRATVRVEAPTWIPLTGAALYSTGGETLATWDLRDADEALRLEDTIEISEDPTWIILVAWGEEPAPPWQEAPAWAVSSPVWLSRP